MNNLVIFDLDGVLIDSRDMHYDALNRALANVGKEYVINKEEHLSLYDGLPTSKKLTMLTEKSSSSLKEIPCSKFLPLNFFPIWNMIMN